MCSESLQTLISVIASAARQSIPPVTQPGAWIATAFGLAMTRGGGIAITVLLLLPGEILPSSLFTWWDKAQHALAFAVLSVLGQFAYLIERRLVLFGLTVYGALIEIAQHATGWRYGEVADWMADLVGIWLGWVLVLAMSRARKPRN